MPSDFLTLETLGTFAGMTATVVILVQFTKGFFKSSCADWAVRLYTLVISVAVQFFVLYANNALTVEDVGLGAINAVLVALTAMGSYEAITDPTAIKSKP